MEFELLQRPPDNTAVTVACDLEGTLTSGETWRAMRDYLLEQGYERRYRRFFLRRTPRLLLFRFGLGNERRFKEQWILGLLQLYAGFSQEEFTKMAAWVAEHALWQQRRQAVVDELVAHRENGRRVVVMTGLFEPILAHFLHHLGHGCEGIGTPVLFENGAFTGRIRDALNVGERKVRHLRPFTRDGRIGYAYGDTQRDIPMLQMSDHPVAVYPDPLLRETAVAHGWRILDEE